MVLEHIFPEDWLEQKGRYAFILGIVYSIVGLLLASVLFPTDPALVALAFTSMLLLPEMYKIFSIEERKESVEKKVTLGELWKDDIELVRIYIFMFLGVMLVFSVGALFVDGLQANSIFREQLELRVCNEGTGANCDLSKLTESGNQLTGKVVDSGGMSFSTDLFFSLLSNNFMVLMACFILALLSGDGAIFLIVWNASVWGTIFGITARSAAAFTGENPIYLFGLIMLIVFPHMIIEAISYFLAAISGSVISKDVILEQFASDRFFEVFSFNLYLLFFALVFVVLGAGVETWVLNNVGIYHEIIQNSVKGLAQVF